MNLYCRTSAAVLILFLLAACGGAEAKESLFLAKIQVAGEIIEQSLPAESNVQQALDQAGIKLGPLDRVEPPVYSRLSDAISDQKTAREPGTDEQVLIRVIRVTEDFSVKEETIPFESQILQTESLPDGAQLLAQSGENGLEEITYRRVYENGEQVSDIPVKWSRVKESTPEVMLVGIRAVFTPLAIPGRLVYLLGKNAWLMEGTTAQRKPLVMTGDLDGRIFTLSSNGQWLLAQCLL